MHTLTTVNVDAPQAPEIDDKPLTSRAASEFLARQGFPFRESTLCRMRCVGGGPVFLKNGSRVFYRPSALTAWVANRTREVANTSQLAA